MNWHYVEQGKQLGPVNDDWILELERSGKISADTLVWREGMTDWKPLREIRSELKSLGMPVNPDAPASTMIVAEAAPGTSGPEAVCAECKRIFPIEDMIRHGNSYICSNCKPIFMQKLSEGANINTGTLRYAGFWIRLLAKFLDSLIIGFSFGLIIGVTGALLIPMSHGATPSIVPALIILILELVAVMASVFYQIFFVGKYGATPGKMICKLKIVTPEGGSFGYGRATGRFFAEMLSAMICDIGYIIVAFDKEKRALHDHICNTRVVYK
jgi:uncharacterized RDD family membrane protein YckC